MQRLSIPDAINRQYYLAWPESRGDMRMCCDTPRAAGKSIMMLGVTASEAQALVEEFGPEGLDLVVNVASQEEADDLVRLSYGWKKRS